VTDVVICERVRIPVGRFGLETMCIGAGQGLAAVFEAVR
jgi:acetyl-CoA acetyltransferase